VYTATDTTYSSLAAGSSWTLNSITAGNFTRGKALRIKFTRGSAFELSTVRFWMNNHNATVNDADIALTAWTCNYVYTSGCAIYTASQTEVLTCPAICLTTGDQTGYSKLPSSKDGETAADGVDLELTSTLTSSAQTEYYTKHLGVSFEPNVTAQDGTYTDFSLQVSFSFQ
jgi:hypothetical protein